MDNLLKNLRTIKRQQPQLASLSLIRRNQILADLAKLLQRNQSRILAANARDLQKLRRAEMRDRLVLNKKRIGEMAQGLLALKKLPDPLNQVSGKRVRPNGLKIEQISVPLGVVAVIYESRPNVTVDLAGLALKSGNGLVLKGGSEAYETNRVLVKVIQQALKKNHLSSNLVYLIGPKEDWQKTLLAAHDLVDVIVPRGGSGLINWVRQHSKVPIIETGAGVCHTFVDASADLRKAVAIIVNAKTQRPSVCNALDTLVIHRAMLKKLLPLLAREFIQFNQGDSLRSARSPLDAACFGAEIFADPAAYHVLQKIYPSDWLKKAKPEHYGQEFLSLKMSIKTVKNFAQGLAFVKKYTSGHSEAILSRNNNHISQFLKAVDAAVVFANASTRFTDGGEFGMGAEVGVSTQKLHARGPMGLQALTSYKWVVKGSGQVR